jgi:hypothetical protein
MNTYVNMHARSLLQTGGMFALLHNAVNFVLRSRKSKIDVEAAFSEETAR